MQCMVYLPVDVCKNVLVYHDLCLELALSLSDIILVVALCMAV